VSLDRLKAFFNESEIPPDVGSFTRDIRTSPEELSIENGSFKWTTGGTKEDESKDKDKKDKKDKGKSVKTMPSPPVTSGPAHATAAEAPVTPAEHPEEPTLVGPEASESTVVDDNLSRASSVLRGLSSDAPVPERVFELRDINLKLAKGKLSVVTGPTASGKTALLMALLGEMDRTSGFQTIPKNPTIVSTPAPGSAPLQNAIAYAAQTPWLQQQSIKDNIVFEYPFDKARYDAVVEACALLPDFKALEDGDDTEIGSKGVSLSGGQKARVALARAVYAPTEYLILDDIFSAVVCFSFRAFSFYLENANEIFFVTPP